MRPILILGFAAVLAACSQPAPEEKAPTEPPAAALPPGRPAVYQAQTEGPEPFVRAVYELTAAGDTAPPPPGRDPIYDRTLNALIGDYFRKAGNEVPTLNYNPICDCQDGTLALQTVTLTPTGEGTADAVVAFTVEGEAKTQTLKLEKEGGRFWKIADILVPGRKPLTNQLLAAIS
ncbi:hypothetical protein ASG17_05975 [Brevundimonas sp. Leaf363]|uniref:DUF3828 domain-containing protein n=1 Tax=Brevundimonas sp. Leaf363 TaxID=1736353 RepID=UPI0006F836C8|nr:DUF3828 domain-containing protein [Brevundimonas sp. Leaf363]KQS55615.1 hypothetical protein ASG17_05975 [Brevundimonas sp. Leaf363]